MRHIIFFHRQSHLLLCEILYVRSKLPESTTQEKTQQTFPEQGNDFFGNLKILSNKLRVQLIATNEFNLTT